MIDLSTCIPGQRVRYLNNAIGTFVGPNGKGEDFFPVLVKTEKGSIVSHTRNGKIYHSYLNHPHDIIEILPIEPPETPMIGLSTCAYGQKVKYRNGDTGTFVGPNFSGGIYPFLTRLASGDTHSHTQAGSTSNCRYGNPHDIVEILPLEIPEEPPMPEPTPTPQEVDYKAAYLQIANIISVAFPECEVTTVDMARLLLHENRTLRLALGLPTYEEVEDLTYTEVYG